MRYMRRCLVLTVLLLASLLAGAPGRELRAEVGTGVPPGAAWSGSARPFSSLFLVPPKPPASVVQPPAAPAGLSVPGSAAVRPATLAGSPTASPGEACRVAIVAAANRYGIPPDLFLAISLVESGRRDPATGTRMPFPWTVNAEGQDYRFETSAQAAAWVRAQQARGLASMDTGCMQVNLKYHPTAFATAEEAFDPVRNADYAARFLRSLYDGPAGGVWMRAAGYYHSQTPERAAWYQGLVEATLKGPLPSVSGGMAGAAPSRLAARPPLLAASGGGQSLSNHAEAARILPLAGGQAPGSVAPGNLGAVSQPPGGQMTSGPVGRGLDAYRSAPIMLARLAPMPIPAPRLPQRGIAPQPRAWFGG